MNFTEFNDIFNAAAQKNGLTAAAIASIDMQKREQLFSLLQLLLAENQKYNLTAIKQPSDAVYKHLIDSILPVGHLQEGAKMVDIGCGAGFPTLPMAIVRPDLSFTSIDSTAKKVNFIIMCVEKIGITNVTPICGRAEELAHMPEYRDRFDIATARAVANLPVLCELCLPFVKPNGHFMALKGRFSQEEFDISPAALAQLSAEGLSFEEYELQTPDASEQRTLVTVTKSGKTKQNFPRKYSVIVKNPLK